MRGFGPLDLVRTVVRCCARTRLLYGIALPLRVQQAQPIRSRRGIGGRPTAFKKEDESFGGWIDQPPKIVRAGRRQSRGIYYLGSHEEELYVSQVTDGI